MRKSLVLLVLLTGAHGWHAPARGPLVGRSLRRAALPVATARPRSRAARPTAAAAAPGVCGGDRATWLFWRGAIDGVPAWRGHLHRNGALLFPFAAAALCRMALANGGHGLWHALGFSAAVQGILTISAVLHTTDWRRRYLARRLDVAALPSDLEDGGNPSPAWIRLLDYSAIFVGIAMIYSSLGGLIMGRAPVFRRLIQPLVWAGAGVGVGGKVFALDTPRWVEAASFLAQGWACILGYHAIRAAITPPQWRLLLSGGLCFSLGVSAYCMQWPNFSWHRSKFRAHEVFHLGTIAGFGCFYLLMLSLLKHM